MTDRRPPSPEVEKRKVIEYLHGDCREVLKTLPEKSVHCCVTSPPYWGLRDYGVDGQLGMEATPEEYVQNMVEVFREVRRVLRDDGTLFLNLGDSYAGSGKGQTHEGSKDPKQPKLDGMKLTIPDIPNGLKPKDLVGIPWRVAFSLQADGWYLRQDIIWHKPNQMPESVTDRCTKAHEYIFLMSKNEKYYYDHEAIKEPVKAMWGTRNRENGKYHNEGSGLQPHSGLENEYTTANKRSVWTVATQPYSGAHFAVFPPNLIRPCILAGCPQGGTVLDPFGGSGTTAFVAEQEGRNAILIELNPAYIELQKQRTQQTSILSHIAA